jgi:Ser/Thr protein kinase RdoA (MazF antagonist)
MFNTLLKEIARAYRLGSIESLEIEPLGEGLIHETLLIKNQHSSWVLQGFNESVFNFPDRIDHNLSILSKHAKDHHLPYQLPLPILNQDGNGLTEVDGKKYRLFDYVKGKTIQQISDPIQAFKAAQAYGEFANWGKEIDSSQMQETIPNFHRLDLRHEKLKEVSKTKSTLTLEEEDILKFYLSQRPLVEWYLDQLGSLPFRVTHNDTKINNLIFSEDLERVEALIDLDTLMAGMLLYDFGDLVRTVACSFPETSTDWDQIVLLPEIFRELLQGYWEGIHEMTQIEEAQSLLLGGEIMTLIMGLRFFTDHLQGNIYYRVAYPEQNFHRAKNQMIFLKSQQEQRENLKRIWRQITGFSGIA